MGFRAVFTAVAWEGSDRTVGGVGGVLVLQTGSCVEYIGLFLPARPCLDCHQAAGGSYERLAGCREGETLEII